MGAFVCAVLLVLVLLNIRHAAAGKPCKHGDPSGTYRKLQRAFSPAWLFSLCHGRKSGAEASPNGDRLGCSSVSVPEGRCRLRDLGVAIGLHDAGPNNAITDVPGVRVGQVTLKQGDGALIPGIGPVRTGVTAIIPREDMWHNRVTAGHFVANGNGIVTGLDRVKQSGCLEGPVLLTNTLNVYSVADAAVSWMISRYPEIGTTGDTYIAVVGECDDSTLNDAQGRHVKPEHVFAALDEAASGPVAEGAVGAGTGMICYDFKGGIGTASRRLTQEQGGYTIGVLLNCNHGDRHQLKVDGVPAGRLIPDGKATAHQEGSIVIVVATDAPLNSNQLDQLAYRATLGLARTGAVANTGSGDFVLSFSTGRIVPDTDEPLVNVLPELTTEALNPLFEAVGEAVEEAVINALCMAQTTVGRDGETAPALPLDRLVAILRRHGRLP